MKTLTNPTGNHTLTTSLLNTVACLFVMLFSLNGLSQAKPMANPKTELTTLQKVVDDIKAKNESIKNEKNITIMVDEMLVNNLQTFIINPKNIAMVEVLVLEPKPNGEKIKPSIIINTKY